MPNPRLHLDLPLAAGAAFDLDEDQARYLATVLRLREGDGFRVFNARDGEWRARIGARAKRSLRVEIAEQLRTATPPRDLHLYFAPVKRQATDLIVEKATEMGVAALHPVITRRTIADSVRLDRLAAIAREAAEQTERCDVPEIHPPVPLVRALEAWDGARGLIYADEAGDDPAAPWGGEAGRGGPLRAAVAAMPPGAPIALLTGPEGGFDPEERRMLRALAFVTPVSLGPRILRAETAVIAALAVIQAGWGDW